MAKILIVDSDGVGLSFAWKCATAGHEVKWYRADKPNISKQIGDGFKGIEKVDNWVSWVKWADLIFPTGNDMFVERLDFFRKKGAKVFGPSVASANLEIKRADGMKMLEKVGIEIAPYVTVKNIAEAIKTVKKTEERYVIKAMGDEEDKALTYCSKSPADMVETLMRWENNGVTPKGNLMLQTFVEGIEVGVSRWVGKDGFVGQWNVSHEFKKLMPHDYACNTGEMGTISYFTKEDKLGTETLGKLEKEIISTGHSGDMALGFIIDDKGKYWPTEFTARAGWPIFNQMLSATKNDPCQWMIDALDGKDSTSFSEEIGCCIVVAQPDFPYGHNTTKELSDVPIYGVTKGNKKHLYPQGVKIDIRYDMNNGKMVSRPVWSTTGDYILVVTALGKDVKQACQRAYGTVEQLNIANMIVRDDVGERLEDQLPKLHNLGYCLHAEYENESTKHKD